MVISERYTTSSGKTYQIKLTYNERIRERDSGEAFVQDVTIIDDDTRLPVAAPVTSSKLSTFEDFTSFGSYCAINYQGTRPAAIEGLRTKVLTRIEDALERIPAPV